MLSCPASGNYLFHEGTVTSVYLGQINRERIVTSPPFCLCLGRRFSLPQRRSRGPTAKPRSRFRSALPADAALGPLPAQQIPASRSPAHSRPRHELLQPLQKFSISCFQPEKDGLLLSFGQAWQYCSLHIHFFIERWKEHGEETGVEHLRKGSPGH